MTYFQNFGTPSISRERFELKKTLILAYILTIRGINDKNSKVSPRVREGSCDLLLEVCFVLVRMIIFSRFVITILAKNN